MNLNFNRISKIQEAEKTITGSQKELRDKYCRNQAEYINSWVQKPVYKGLLGNLHTGELDIYG